ncbi:MAG: flavin-containing monooxygenase, partial [Nannocystaceae bacterium]
GTEYRADFFVNAVGGLHQPAYPDVPGRAEFRGQTTHTGIWDDTIDLRDQRVAVIGSAASAVQLVPAIADLAKSVTVFQRTPNYLVPKGNYAYSERQKRRFRRWPWTQRAHRWWFYWRNETIFSLLFKPGRWTAPIVERYLRWELRRAVPDPELHAKIAPNYRAGCKRILVDSDYYGALTREDVALVCDPIDEITPEGPRCDDHVYPADVLVYATGFEIWDRRWVGKIYGRDGLSLADATGDAPRTHLGMSLPRFPNFFALLGPNTGLGHSSVVWMMECQVRYIRRLIVEMREASLELLEPREDLVDRAYAHLQQRLSKSVWATGGCRSWYRNEAGEIIALWPGHTYEYWWKTRRPNLSDYMFIRESS